MHQIHHHHLIKLAALQQTICIETKETHKQTSLVFSGAIMGNSLQPHGHAVQDNEAIQDLVTVTATEATTCEICMEPLSPGNVFNNSNRCVHPFCLDCTAKYVKFKILDDTGNIPCPAWKCKQLLDPMFCKRIISRNLFDKWCDALCFSALPEVQYRCYCPYEGCSALMINECEDESVRKVQCLNCKQYFCFKCQVPWHEKNRCEESHNKDRNDAMFAQLVQRKRWRRCYNCGHWVERVTGCETIHCR